MRKDEPQVLDVETVVQEASLTTVTEFCRANATSTGAETLNLFYNEERAAFHNLDTYENYSSRLEELKNRPLG